MPWTTSAKLTKITTQRKIVQHLSIFLNSSLQVKQVPLLVAMDMNSEDNANPANELSINHF